MVWVGGQELLGLDAVVPPQLLRGFSLSIGGIDLSSSLLPVGLINAGL